MTKSNSNRNRRSQRSRGSGNGPLRYHPAPYLASCRFKTVARFANSTSTVSATVSAANIGTALGVLATSATNSYPVIVSARIKRVRIWTLPSTSTTTTCAIQWLGSTGNTNASQVEHSDTSLSTAEPAFVDSVPPPDSSASWWFATDGSVTTPLLFISASGPSVVDVFVDCVLSDGNAMTAYTSSGMTAGRVYYSPLQGASGNLAPVSRSIAP